MPTPFDTPFPVDPNGNAVPVLPHDFNDIVGGCVMLAGSTYALTEDAIYRIVGDSDLFFAYGGGATAALTPVFGLNAVRLPANQIEYLRPRDGQTSLSVVSELADGSCFNLARMR